jgi:hypothetical protein
MTGDLPGPDQRAAQQTHQAAARLYEQAAAGLDRAAAHCRVASTHSEGPRCRGGRRTPGRRWGISARQNGGWRSRLVPTASRRASRACVEDHLWAVTGGTYDSRCRRLGSPQSSQEVPAETQEEPAGTGRGTGTQRKDRCSGGPETSGVVAGNRGGPVWPLEVPLRGAVAHRLRPVGISDQARSVTAGAGLAFRVPATPIGRPPRTSTVVHPISVKRQACCARPFGTLDGGGGGALGGGRGPGRAAGWPAGLCEVVMSCCLLAWSSLLG